MDTIAATKTVNFTSEIGCVKKYFQPLLQSREFLRYLSLTVPDRKPNADKTAIAINRNAQKCNHGYARQEHCQIFDPSVQTLSFARRDFHRY